MPYGLAKSKGGDTAENDARMERCVAKVEAKGNSHLSAILICKKSLGFTKGR